MARSSSRLGSGSALGVRRSSTSTMTTARRPAHALLVLLAVVAIVQLVLSTRSPSVDAARAGGAGALSRRSSSSSSIDLDSLPPWSNTSSRSSSSSSSAISIQKNKKVKACQPIPVHKKPHSICAHVRSHCALDGHIDYLSTYFCAGLAPTKHSNTSTSTSNIALARAAVLAAILAWLLFLFSSVGLTASDFFSPNLSTLAARLRLSESTAGVSLLAFGNGSPDVFSTFAAMRSGSGSLAIGELIGAASFITAVVAAAMMLIQPFRVKPYPFLRDVGFFTVAIALALFVLLDGTLHIAESIALVALYVLYATIVIVGGWWQERRRQRKLAQRAGLYGAKETRPSIIEAGFHFPTTQDQDEDDDGEGLHADERTPLRTASAHNGPALPTSASSSGNSAQAKSPNLKLQIPQTPTPLQRKPSHSRFLAPPSSQAGSAPSSHTHTHTHTHTRITATSAPAASHSASSTPLASPAILTTSSFARSPSAIVRSEYEPDADDEATAPIQQHATGYATEPNPFDRAVASPATAAAASASASATSPSAVANLLIAARHTATAPLAAGIQQGEPSGAAGTFTFPPLPASAGAGAGGPSGAQTVPVPAPAAGAAAALAGTTSTGLNAAVAAGAAAGQQQQPLTPSSSGAIRPGYYLPRHSLLGAIEFRDVVRSLQAESAAAALLLAPGPRAGAAAARTPGEYHADDSADDDEDDEDDDSDGSGAGAGAGAGAGPGARGMRRSQSGQAHHQYPLHDRRRPTSLFGTLGLGSGGGGGSSSENLAHGHGRDSSAASRVGSVSRKGKGKGASRGLLSSLGFRAGSGGSTAGDDEEIDGDERAAVAGRVPHRRGSRTHTRARGSSLSAAPNAGGEDAAALQGPMSAYPTPARQASQRLIMGTPHLDAGARFRHLRTQSTSAGAGAMRPFASGGGGGIGGYGSGSGGEGGTPRDRGWELFYSRGLELENDWERLASPAGAVGSAADRSREAVRQHLLMSHAHPPGPPQQQHHRHHHHHHHHHQSGNRHHRSVSQQGRRRSQNRGGGAEAVSASAVLPGDLPHRRALSSQPAVEAEAVKANALVSEDEIANIQGSSSQTVDVLPVEVGGAQPALADARMADFSFAAGAQPKARKGESYEPSPLQTPGGHRAQSPEPSTTGGAPRRPDALPRLEIPTSSTGRSLAKRVQAQAKLVDVDDDGADARSDRSVPSITVDKGGSHAWETGANEGGGEEGEEAADAGEHTPRPGDATISSRRSGRRTRTLSASTTLTADDEEEARGLRLRTTSNGSYAHARPALYGIEEGGSVPQAGAQRRGFRHRAWMSVKRSRRYGVHVWDHLLFDSVGPIAQALFPSLRHIGSKSVVGILVSVLSVPAIFVLKLTLPVVVDEEEEEEMAVELQEELERERAEAQRRGAAAAEDGLAGRAGSRGSRRSLLNGPVRLDGGERPLVARKVIESPQPISASPATPRPRNANDDVAAGLAALPNDPGASLGGSTAVGQTASRKNKGESTGDNTYDEDEGEDDEVDGSESCDSYDDAAAADEALAFYEREERKRRATASRFLALVQLSLGPTFCTWAILSPKTLSLQDPQMRTVLRVFVVGTALALLCAASLLLGARRLLTRRPAVRRTLSLVRCLGGFVVSVMFIMTIVDEVVSILQTIGIIMGLSDAILGLTIFAMGNSLGDLVANVTIARMGHPVMAISACFAGPLLNILLGIGLSGTYIMTSHQGNGFEKPELVLDFSPTLLVSCIGLLVILVGILIAVPLNGFYLDRKLGSVLIITYGIIMCINILTEIFVDKD